jgi:hypothetical protein
VGEQAPLATALKDVEDGVEDLTKIVDPRPSVLFGYGQMGLDGAVCSSIRHRKDPSGKVFSCVLE